MGLAIGPIRLADWGCQLRQLAFLAQPTPTRPTTSDMGNSSLSKQRRKGEDGPLLEQGWDPTLPRALVVDGAKTCDDGPVVVGAYAQRLRSNTAIPEKGSPSERPLVAIDGHFVADPRPSTGGRGTEGQRKATSGNLPLFRCTKCESYVSGIEFQQACVHHTARYTPGKWCRWECCKATGHDAPGCCRLPAHTEDLAFSNLTRSLGCEPSPADLQRQRASLFEFFGEAFDGNCIRVRLRKEGSTVLVDVPAPPVPDIAGVKAVVLSLHPHWAGRTIQIGTAPVQPLTPVEPLHDSLPLTRLPSSARLPAQRKGEEAAITLFVLSPPRHKRGTPARGADWVLVPVRVGDTLAKFALQHNLDTATIKSANGIVSSDIEAWRDELWLPPLAGALGSPSDPSVEAVVAFKQQLAKQTGAPPAPVERIEAEAYLAMYGGDAGEAAQAFRGDTEWAATHPMPSSRFVEDTARDGGHRGFGMMMRLRRLV